MKTTMNKISFWVGILLVTLSVFFSYRQIKTRITSSYLFERDYSSLWYLGEKASTIEAKEKFVDAFYNALKTGQEQGKFAEWSAIWLKTPKNNFSTNLIVLSSLKQRLGEIKGMNPNSFEYNTAIQQITAQEQRDSGMIHLFKECYQLQNYPNIWSWFGLVWFIGLVIGMMAGLICLVTSFETIIWF